MTTQSESSRSTLSTITVKSIMSKHVEYLMTDDKISDALSMMIDQGLTTAPVVNSDDKCVGILSRSDLTDMLLDEDGELARILDTSVTFGRFCESLETCESRKVSEMMTYDVQTIHEEASIVEACQMMVGKKIHHLPVVNSDEKVVGIISSMDVVKAVAQSA